MRITAYHFALINKKKEIKKMKKFVSKILLAMALTLVTYGYTTPTYAFAEEATEVTSSVIETETPEETPTEEPTEEPTETPEVLPEEPVEEPVETPTEEAVEDTNHTFDDFLAWVQTEADKYGYGEDFAGAIEAITAAATQEQVTLSTIGSLLMMVAVIAYTIYKKVTDSKFKTEVSNLSKSLSNQFEKLKELVDGTNSNTKTEEEISAKSEEIKKDEEKIKNALSQLISAFMHFSSHVGMQETHKLEVQRDCMNALQCIDGDKEVNANDGDKK